MEIHQGDQYGIPVEIQFGGKIVTPEDCDDVRIKIGETMKSYAASEITFDAETKMWSYPLTEEQSRSYEKNRVSAQVAVKIGNDFIYSDVQQVIVSNSVIKEAWAE